MENRAYSGVAGSDASPTATLSTRDLEEQIALLSASITVATWRLLMLIGELDRRNAWQQWGVLSCAHWLNWKCGIDMGAAREKVRSGRALESLPLVSDALAGGEVSYSKARSTHAQRALRWSFEDDGAMVFTVRVPAEQGMLVVQAIHAAVDAQWRKLDGADRELDGAAGEPGAVAEVSAEASCTFVPSSNSFDNAESPVSARRADALRASFHPRSAARWRTATRAAASRFA